MLMRILQVTLSVALVLGSVFSASAAERFVFREPHMGTLFRIILYADGEAEAKRAAEAAFARVGELNACMSDYERDSEVNRLSRTSGSGEWVEVSPDLWKVLRAAQAISAKTNGRFDVTVGAYVKQWRVAKGKKVLPSVEDRERAARGVGFQKMEFDEAGRRVKLKSEGTAIDLGGIAKGFALDEALRVLRERFKITRALVDGGGDIAVGDAPPGKDGWTLAIEDADPDGQRIIKEVVTVSNAALATSGDARQFLEIDGVRYSHIIDPSTGLGLTRRVQASVIAETGMMADAYASVMCLRVGGEHVEPEGELQIRILTIEKDGTVNGWSSKNFGSAR